MIPKNELRLGNYVKALHPREEIVQIFDLSTTICKAGEYLNGYEDINGIELTNEWFNKLGFDGKSGTFDYQDKELKEFGNTDTGISIPAFFFNKRLNRWMDCHSRVCVDYVHQLQNLFYCQTYKELEVVANGS